MIGKSSFTGLYFEFSSKMISWEKKETSCLIYKEDNKVQKKSKNNAFSFQSQGTHYFWVAKQTQNIEFYNSSLEILRTEMFE